MTECPQTDVEGADQRCARNGFRSVAPAWWATIGLAWLATLGVSLALFAYTLDDSWITYRYSRNLIEGHGLKWNPTDDQAFEAYTSFSHVLVTAGLEALGIDPTTGSKVLGMGFNLLLLVLLARFCSEERIPFAVFAGLAATVAATHLFGFHAVSGMDTFLYITILTLATALLFRVLRSGEGLPAFCLCLTAGALTRPDCAVLFGGYLLILWFLRPALRRRLAGHLLLWTLIPGALYAGFKLAYFGSLLPNSFHFKASTDDGILPGRVYVRQFATAYLLIPFAFSLWLWRTRRLAREEFWSLAALASAVLFYITIRPKVGVGFRFLVPLLPSFLLVLSRPAGRLWSAGTDKRWAALYVALLPLAGLAVSVLAWPDLQRYLEPRTINPRLGRALAGLPNAESRVLVTGEAGAIPYYSRTHHLDLLGLVSKAGAHSMSDASWVFEHRPEIIVTHSIMADPTADGGFVLDRRHSEKALASPANNVVYLSYQVLTHPEAARFRLLWKVPARSDPQPDEYYYLFLRETSDLLPLLTRRGRELMPEGLRPAIRGAAPDATSAPGSDRMRARP